MDDRTVSRITLQRNHRTLIIFFQYDISHTSLFSTCLRSLGRTDTQRLVSSWRVYHVLRRLRPSFDVSTPDGTSPTYLSLIPESFQAHFDDTVNFVESANDPPDRGYVIRLVLNTFFVSVSNVSFLDTYDSFLTLSDMTIFHKTSPDKHYILAVHIRFAGRKAIA